jgi:ABC-type Fe3+ transport system permease subunit
MARRKRVQGLSPFSWEKEAGLSAARQRLLGPTEAVPARSKGRRTVWRVLGWSLTLAIIAAAIFGAVALKLRWPAMRSSRGHASRSADAISLCAEGAP